MLECCACWHAPLITLPWFLQSFIEKTDLEGLQQARQEDHEGMLQFNKTMMDVSWNFLMPGSSCACL